MWVAKDDNLINLNNIDSIEFEICEDDNQFELDFYKNDKINSYLFFDNEKELRNAFLNIKTALKIGKNFLEL